MFAAITVTPARQTWALEGPACMHLDQLLEMVAHRDTLLAHHAERHEQYRRVSDAWRGGQW